METPRRSATDFVIDHILAMIEKGQLNTGDKLPTERELASELNVSRVSLREALSALAILGVLEPRQGAGTYVGAFRPASMGKVFFACARLEATPLTDLVHVRRALEAEAAWQGAQKATAQQLDQLKAALAAFDKATGEESRSEADLDFHRNVALCGGNVFLLELLESTALAQRDLAKALKAPKLDKATLATYYHRVCDAMVAQDAQGAYSAMYECMAWMCQALG